MDAWIMQRYRAEMAQREFNDALLRVMRITQSTYEPPLEPVVPHTSPLPVCLSGRVDRLLGGAS